MPDIEFESFTPEKQPAFWSAPDDGNETWIKLTYVKQLPDSDAFEVGPKGKKKPAPVFLVKDEFNDEFRLTETSSTMKDCRLFAQKKLGEAFWGTQVQLRRIGSGKEGRYEIRWAKNIGTKLDVA
jgi:hypothetical protein